MAWLFPLAVERVDTLQVRGEVPQALVTPEKATRVGVGIIKRAPYLSKAN